MQAEFAGLQVLPSMITVDREIVVSCEARGRLWLSYDNYDLRLRSKTKVVRRLRVKLKKSWGLNKYMK